MSFRKHALLGATAMLAISMTLAGCGEEKKEEQAAEQPAAEPAQPAAPAPAPAATEQAATPAPAPAPAPAAAPTGADVKVGILFDITGPIANFIPPMMDSVTLATDEVNAGGGLLGGKMVAAI